MSKKFLFGSLFKAFNARFKKNEEIIQAGLKYVDAIPQIGHQFDYQHAQIKLPEKAAEVIIMYPGEAVEKYKEIMSIWFAYCKADWKPFENTVSMLDTIITGWDDGQIVGSHSFEVLQNRLNELQDLYMRYWRRMEEEEKEYIKILRNDECVDRAFMKLYTLTDSVSYSAILRTIIGKYCLVKKYPETNLRRDERISDRLHSLCITLSKCMDSMSIEDDDSGFDRYRYEANRLLFFINWYNNLLERDIGFNIIVAKCAVITIPVKVYPKHGGWIS